MRRTTLTHLIFQKAAREKTERSIGTPILWGGKKSLNQTCLSQVIKQINVDNKHKTCTDSRQHENTNEMTTT